MDSHAFLPESHTDSNGWHYRRTHVLHCSRIRKAIGRPIRSSPFRFAAQQQQQLVYIGQSGDK